ncbi:hypothetical protein [Streptomyces sp. NPDC048643]
MTAVMVEITPAPATVDPEAVVLVADVSELTASVVPGCGDDNPYN